jgi:regulatory protein
MKITKIEQQKHNEHRFSVFIDDRFAFGLTGTDVLYYKLEEGIELSPEKYNYIIEESVFSKARDKAVKFLSYRARSRKELYDKLLSAENDFSEEIIDRVIELMEKYGYIDDLKFAQSFIRDKRNLRGCGEIRIRHELKEKGVRGDIIESAFAELPTDETAAALKLLEKKYKFGNFTDQNEKKKAYGFLLRKGYSYEIIHAAMQLFDEQDEH